MFEHDQEIVNSLLNENNDFKRLYEKHDVLKNTVKDANDKNLKVDQLSLEGLKKEIFSGRLFLSFSVWRTSPLIKINFVS